ncbi:MAG: helicase HerA-like domain-containing protein, partial [Candidatus Hodarchaeales archaeon]
TNEGKAELQESYGRISTSSIGTILRKIVELEQQGADQFFGEKSFEVDDLLRIDENGNGVISILRLTDLQDRPKLFTTFMLSLLAEIYSSFPEEGDLEQPKLVIFIDEAHLIFEEATKVNCQIRVMDYFSGHADQRELIDYLRLNKTKKLKNVFLVHGEQEQALPLREKLVQKAYGSVSYPVPGEKFEI